MNHRGLSDEDELPDVRELRGAMFFFALAAGMGVAIWLLGDVAVIPGGAVAITLLGVGIWRMFASRLRKTQGEE